MAAAEAMVSVALVSASNVAPRYHWKLVARADVAVYCNWLPGQAVAGPLIAGASGVAGLRARVMEFDTAEVPHEFTPYAVYVPASMAAADAMVSVALVSAKSV